jgi:UDP-N-acetylmuramyl tripeptide synthase
MPKRHTILIGKTLRRLARLRGGGSALPGLFVEKIEPGFLKEALEQLPHGIVLVSGTNGKTTTTKLIAETLAMQDLRVFTNRTGSNFTRGVVAALVSEIDLNGTLPYDIAVLELDEAHAVHFVEQVKPTVSVLLNVMRDQLDRFGEIDYTTKLLTVIAENTTGTIVLNNDNPFTRSIAEHFNGHRSFALFDADQKLKPLFVADLPAKTSAVKELKNVRTHVTLESFDEQHVTFSIDGKKLPSDLHVTGHHNFINAAAALATCRVVVTAASPEKILADMSQVMPAFGRGETTSYKGAPLEFVLVKNPAGFKAALTSAAREVFLHKKVRTMIAINDNYADGRDMSWLWDVDFSSLKDSTVAQVSGSRAYDMALRLQYDNVHIGSVDTNLKKALLQFLKQGDETPMRIFCTYTAMLTLRNYATRLTDLEKAL